MVLNDASSDAQQAPTGSVQVTVLVLPDDILTTVLCWAGAVISPAFPSKKLKPETVGSLSQGHQWVGDGARIQNQAGNI